MPYDTDTKPEQIMTVLSQSRVFRLADAPVRRLPNGGESRDILQGVLATGEAIKIHESLQPKGVPPNPAHAIEHTEFILVMDGTLEIEHDGKTEQAGPGGVLYVAFGTMHRVRNAGDGPAKYAVISIGGDIKA
jgi:quercetin dioxygenase-like cupin family protein